MPYTVAPEVSIFDAKKMMNDYEIRHIPVFDRGELKGVISDRDIRTAEAFHGPGYLTVGDAISDVPYTVHPNTSFSEVLTNMINRRIGSALVVGPRGEVIGIFTTHDALHILRALVLLGSREQDLEQKEVQDQNMHMAA
jgi:CBS domain-containing protein